MAISYNHYLDQGTTFSYPVTVTGVDLTSATIESQIRTSYTSTTFIPFTITPIDLVNGKFSLNLDATTTATMADGRWIYDLIYKIGTTVTRYMEGQVVVYPRSSQ
jgi:hypothetical protein